MNAKVFYHPKKDNFCLMIQYKSSIGFEYQGAPFEGRKIAKVPKFVLSMSRLKNHGWLHIGDFEL